jgi:hypothetical protein
MAATYASFTARYPEFLTITAPSGVTVQEIVGAALDDADAFLSDSAFGNMRDRAQCLYAAHYLALRWKVKLPGLSGQDSPGIATSVSAETGGLAVTKTVSALAQSRSPIYADFSRTNYGLEYLRIVSMCIPGGMLV